MQYTWSVTNYGCDWCGIRYDPNRNVKYKRKDFCGQKCKQDWLDVQAHVDGTGEGTYGDNPNTLFWEVNPNVVK